VNATPKRVFGSPRSPEGPSARRVSVSLYPAHLQTLDQRERELNVGRSTLAQLLLEVEERDHVLRHELLNRLRRSRTTATPNKKEQHGSTQKHQLEDKQ